MSDNDIKTICEKIGSLQEKILKSKFAETVTESEMLCLILAVRGLNDQKAEIAVLTTAVDNSTKEFLKLHDEYQDQNAEIEKLQEVNADLNESLRLAAEANKDLNAEIERLKAEQMMAEGYADVLEERAKTEAIKEFAERLKETPIELGLPLLGLLTKSEIEGYFNHTLLQVRDAIDNLVAEMTEGE